MNLIDYTFYRLYLNYKKGDKDAAFTNICFFTVIVFFLMYPLAIFLLTLIDSEDKTGSILILIYPIFIFIYLIKYYNKKKITFIKSTYKKHPYYKTIKGWIFYISGFSIIWIGILFSAPAAKLAKWILLN